MHPFQYKILAALIAPPAPRVEHAAVTPDYWER